MGDDVVSWVWSRTEDIGQTRSERRIFKQQAVRFDKKIYLCEKAFNMKKLILMASIWAACNLAAAQDLIVLKTGNPINAYRVELGEKSVFYSLENDDNALFYRVDKENVLMIRRADGSVADLSFRAVAAKTTDFPAAPSQPSFPEIKDEDIHGCIIAEGNCVYIPTDSSLPFEKAGQEQIRKCIKEWGYWKVVDEPSQAHFVLQYLSFTSGGDVAYLIGRHRENYLKYPSLSYDQRKGGLTPAGAGGCVFGWTRGGDKVDENIETAGNMIQRVKTAFFNPKGASMKCFWKYYQEPLEAEAKLDKVLSLGAIFWKSW